MLLAIETSCDDTCVSLLDPETGRVLRNDAMSQLAAHEVFGGVVPEIAGRKHLEALPALFRHSLSEAGVDPGGLTAVCVTRSPGLIGSLLVGVNFAKTLAWCLDVPLIPVDHVEGHLLSVFLDHPDTSFPYLCLVASGGHSHFAMVEGVGEYRLLGKTRDDAIGEAYDKTAKVLGLTYPGGPLVDKVAAHTDEEGCPFPIPLGSGATTDFSLSGLKTAVKYKAMELGVYAEKEVLMDYEAFAASAPDARKKRERIMKGFQKTVEKMVVQRFRTALERHPAKTLAFVGGVSANRGLRKTLGDFAEANGVELKIPSFQYCTDNAAMIGAAALLRRKNGEWRGTESVFDARASSNGLFSRGLKQ